MKKARWLTLVSILFLLGSFSPALYGEAGSSGPDIVPAQTVDPIPNRTLAFGDSITCTPDCWNMASVVHSAQEEPYPAKLEQTLDVRVAQSEVINAGKSGEATYGGSERITGQVSTHRPKYVLILEGTNDVTRDKNPSDVKTNLENMIDNARETAGVTGVEVMLATIIPRTDGKNDATEQMNALAVVPAAQSKGVPVCDLWVAMMSRPNWQYLLDPDGKHPNEAGRALIADTFYQCMLAFFPGVNQETVPPDAWIESLPPTVECGEPVTLPATWAGTDNLSWVVDYDVQARMNNGAWTDWLMGTQKTTGTYYGPSENTYGDRFYFQVRARDLVGNVGAYSEPAYSEVTDSVPPTEAHVNLLPGVLVAPFEVSWWGADACSGVTAYGVQYRNETDAEWQTWLSPTLSLSGSFSPTIPRYGETYEFRVRPQDAAGNWGDWSAVEASTILAQWTIEGQVLNTRHEPVAGAAIGLDPSALYVAHQPGGRFLAYLDEGGSYDVSVARPDRYGPLPAMVDVAQSAHVSGLSFILPPADDAVADGGFEAGNLDAWQVGGSVPPTLSVTGHTGLSAVRLGGAGASTYLRQRVTPAQGERPTLSFLVRLDQPGPASALQVELANRTSLSSPVMYTVPVDSEAWLHTWYDLTGLVSEPLTITFRVSDAAAVILDEISLGSSRQGHYPIYLPFLVQICRVLG
ncbi:MAG: hypothetical protein JXM73_07255 [Anaerolineae bacterium]|nr:hypothetical protein [Anaerolineae bacterium]